MAFSDESSFDINKTAINESFFNTLGDHERKIGYLRHEGILPPQHVKREWKTLIDFKAENFLTRNPEGMVVPPLTTTKWNQGEFYNAFTPQDTDPDGQAGGTTMPSGFLVRKFSALKSISVFHSLLTC